MAELYGIDRSIITKHLKKVFSDNELKENSACLIFAHTAEEGKKLQSEVLCIAGSDCYWF